MFNISQYTVQRVYYKHIAFTRYWYWECQLSLHTNILPALKHWYFILFYFICVIGCLVMCVCVWIHLIWQHETLHMWYRWKLKGTMKIGLCPLWNPIVCPISFSLCVCVSLHVHIFFVRFLVRLNCLVYFNDLIWWRSNIMFCFLSFTLSGCFGCSLTGFWMCSFLTSNTILFSMDFGFTLFFSTHPLSPPSISSILCSLNTVCLGAKVNGVF